MNRNVARSLTVSAAVAGAVALASPAQAAQESVTNTGDYHSVEVSGYVASPEGATDRTWTVAPGDSIYAWNYGDVSFNFTFVKVPAGLCADVIPPDGGGYLVMTGSQDGYVAIDQMGEWVVDVHDCPGAYDDPFLV